MIGHHFQRFLWTSLVGLAFTSLRAQQVHDIDLSPPPEALKRGHLMLGGHTPQGDSLLVNSQYVELNQVPFVPIVGEFHYARYPADFWEESILKMKAGGINVIATYVFWNLHEYTEGEFDWQGNLDLRRFLQLCAKHHLYTIVRLGPFAHGEMRNGGLPDWLYGRPFEVRSNDPGYVAYVERLYGQIAHQLQGLLYKDGGHVIGVQLENEFQHSAAQWELSYPGTAPEYTVAARDEQVTHAGVSVSHIANENEAYGQDHMVNLKKIAYAKGLDVPLYTATGWGNAAIVPRGSLPVTAGYVYPTWAPPAPSPFYLFKDIRRQPDYSPVSYETTLYPSIPAELGSGIQITTRRRPTVLPESLEPLIVRTLGSGSNGIGYYMYHGGSTPSRDGKYFSEEIGGLPKISYDFQAPIGEYGQLRPHYHSLRLLHLFLESYGDRLAPMTTYLPANHASLTPTDTETLRYAVRTDQHAGFIFLNNFQDHVATHDLSGLQLRLQLPDAAIQLPERGTFTLPSGTSAILPFLLNLEGTLLRTATVQPLTILRPEGQAHYVFFSHEGLPPELVFAGSPSVKTENCRATTQNGSVTVRGPADEIFRFQLEGKNFLVLPRALALQAWKSHDEHLLFSESTLLEQDTGWQLLSLGTPLAQVLVYPTVKTPVQVTGATLENMRSPSKLLSAFQLRFREITPDVHVEQVTPNKYTLSAPSGWQGLHDVFLQIHYTGDRAMAFVNGQLVADHFYYGPPWEMGLRRFKAPLQQQDMTLFFHPIRKEYAYLTDLSEAALPDFSEATSVLEIKKIDFVPEYAAFFHWQ
ncbi:Glycosyl hydrolases family 35 [Catalinimonas alkaloidigena]|uniref:Glycosyl hydrolases family 35 n=2 Tax=Catalinimonas alkaloidigena TaxID=1075417 RepID=A0A1G8Y637_9BACT|nr:Glycosyl hydrolases family 35 [Catalinimonas alkaloidigena]